MSRFVNNEEMTEVPDYIAAADKLISPYWFLHFTQGAIIFITDRERFGLLTLIYGCGCNKCPNDVDMDNRDEEFYKNMFDKLTYYDSVNDIIEHFEKDEFDNGSLCQNNLNLINNIKTHIIDSIRDEFGEQL